MSMSKKYWKGIDELKETPAFVEHRDQEFPKSMSVEEFLTENLNETSTPRRDFLKFLGFSVAAASLAACEAPVVKAIPYVNKPENVIPGMPTWYASTYYDGLSYAGILVKTREGRPIYIKGNSDYGFTKGSTNPQILASVLGLYDSARLKGPKKDVNDIDWKTLDKEVKEKLTEIKNKSGKVVLISNSIISPSTQTAIDKFKDFVGVGFEHISYDAISYAAIRKANQICFVSSPKLVDKAEDTSENTSNVSTTGIIPSYDFSKAKTIVSFGADFLSTWLLATEYQSQYATRRNPDGEWMSKHFQFESILSITGSNADMRAMMKPSEEAAVLSYLLSKFGVNTDVASNINSELKKVADSAYSELKKSGKESLIVSGSNSTAIQIMVNKLNVVLGAYSTSIDYGTPVNLFKSEEEKLHQLITQYKSGKKPDAVLLYGVNPVYSLAHGEVFAKFLKDIDLTVSFSLYADETSSLCKYIAPDHHALEAWNDYNPKAGHYAIAQPTIRPIHNSSAAQESLLVWSDQAKRGGKDSKVFYDLIKYNWTTYGFPMQTEFTDAEMYWNMMVHNSSSSTSVPSSGVVPSFNDSALSNLNSTLFTTKGIEVVLYQKAAIGTGMHTGNPWLQEMPDPISKVTWDNYITMNPVEMIKQGYVTTYDQENGLNQAKVSVNGESVILPVYPSPGQALGTIGIALGYGRGANNEEVGNAAYQTMPYGGYVLDSKGNRTPVGKNVYSFTQLHNGTLQFVNSASITKVDGMYAIAATQIHHTLMGRDSIVKETTLSIYKNKEKEAYNPAHNLETHHGPEHISNFDLWEAHPVENIGHRWGMTIDLSSCIGCGTCMIACQSENNVPVVGKDEVRRGREMHWIRIDRYYSSDEEVAVGVKKDKKNFNYDEAELSAVNPKVVHMPMMCHHCNHAPCETVCPVAATNHSNEGLNQMAYNRCIGTRYCANNCPYKVRRFNWFNYPSYKKFTQINPAQDDLGRMVLNPDVTVRTRGVMEKCSFCVQKIQAAKLSAKNEGRAVEDGEVSTACSEVCPTNAIIVGDWNDKKSMVRKSADDKRAYFALEEVGIKPNVWYKVKVRNEENKALSHIQVVEETAHHAGKEDNHKKGH